MRTATVSLVFLLLLLAVSAAAAPAADRIDDGFPRVSKYQIRQPISAHPGPKLATQDHDACGPNPSIPYNCIYMCNNGVPVHDENGDPVLICWYEPDPGGGGCAYGSRCASNGFCYYASIYYSCGTSYYNCYNC